MDPSEVEFLAEKEFVKIIPNFSLNTIYLIGVSREDLLMFAENTKVFNYKLVLCLDQTSG